MKVKANPYKLNNKCYYLKENKKKIIMLKINY